MRARTAKISCAIILTLTLGFVPACPAYADWTVEDSTNLSSFLSSINGNLEYIYYDQQSILNQLTAQTVGSYDSLRKIITDLKNTNHADLNFVNNSLTTLKNYLDGVEGKLDTLNTSIGNITTNDYSSAISGLANLVTSIVNNTATLTTQMTTNNSLIGDVVSGLSTIDADIGTTNTRLNTLKTAVDAVKTAVDAVTSAVESLDLTTGDVTVNTDLTTVEASLEEIEDTLIGLGRQLQSILTAIQGISSQGTPPSNSVTNQIIGNFDFDGFEDDVDDLKDTIANLVPFGAINLLSALVNILGNVAPPVNPSMQFDFDFFGQNTIEIDLSWLDDLKPTINFVMMLALMMSLATVSAKYVRNEASV